MSNETGHVTLGSHSALRGWSAVDSPRALTAPNRFDAPKDRMKRTTSIVLLSFAALVVGGTAAYRILTQEDAATVRRQSAPLVKTSAPTREDVAIQLQFTGDILARREAAIYSKVSGNLEQVYVDIGVHVKAGQPLALIDTTVLYQQFEQTRATYQNASLNYRRTKELLEQNLVAQQDVDNAEAAMKVASANFETARAQLGYAHINAPFTGTITKRFLDPGGLVSVGNPTLFTLMELRAVKVIVNVLEKDIPLITLGTKAVVTVDAYPGRQFSGTVARYSDALDLSTRTMAVEIDIPNESEILKPGMFAAVTLLVAQHPDAITVPTDALLKDDTGMFVYTVVSDTARKVRVTPGAVAGDRTEILRGLDGTEAVVTTGQQFARDGSAVSVLR